MSFGRANLYIKLYSLYILVSIYDILCFYLKIFCHAEINSFHLEGQPLTRCQFITNLKRCLDILGVVFLFTFALTCTSFTQFNVHLSLCAYVHALCTKLCIYLICCFAWLCICAYSMDIILCFWCLCFRAYALQNKPIDIVNLFDLLWDSQTRINHLKFKGPFHLFIRYLEWIKIFGYKIYVKNKAGMIKTSQKFLIF